MKFGKLITGYVILFFLVGILFFFIGFGDNSTGTRVGVPVKLSHKGWIWQTYEGELSIRGTQAESLPYIWKFSICDQDSYKIAEMQNAIDRRQEIQVQYESPMIYYQWNQKSKYCIQNIEVLE